MRHAAICAAEFGALLALVGLNADTQCVRLTTAGSASRQNFDTLANTGTTLTGFDVACTGEQRRAPASTVEHRLLGTIT